MNTFSQKIEQLLDKFSPYLMQQAVISSPFFTKEKANIGDFIVEIQETIKQLQQQTQPEYAEIYAEKLLHQFDALNKAVTLISKAQQNKKTFRSHYQFPKHVHTLKPEKRLIEYRKALRALNDKISWLVEKQLNSTDEVIYNQLQQSIMETEHRKQRCLSAIEELEELTLFKN